MTTTLPTRYRPRPATAEVVAGLVNDGSAVRVARAAVEEAEARHAPVRFIQVLPASYAADAEEASDAEERTFSAAMRALSRHSRVRATFEVVRGDPVEVLVARSQDASVLVLGEDRPDAPSPVAAGAQSAAQCPVRLVPAIPDKAGS